jgi:hypothetical protein
MSDENAPVLLEPSQLANTKPRIFPIRGRIRTRKPAKSGPPVPAASELGRPTYEERFEEDRQDKSHEAGLIQHLVETTRGIALILYSTRNELDETVAWNLGAVLRKAAESVDAYYFGSLGELNDAIGDDYLEVLLKRKLKEVRGKISNNKRDR